MRLQHGAARLVTPNWPYLLTHAGIHTWRPLVPRHSSGGGRAQQAQCGRGSRRGRPQLPLHARRTWGAPLGCLAPASPVLTWGLGGWVLARAAPRPAAPSAAPASHLALISFRMLMVASCFRPVGCHPRPLPHLYLEPGRRL